MKKKWLGFVFLMILVLLSACSRKLSWVSTNYGNQFNASYQLFDGKQLDFIKIEAGETLTLDFDVVVNEGALTLQLVDQDQNIVWAETFTASAKGDAAYTAEVGGRYTLAAVGDDTSGGFEIIWEISD